MFDGVLNTFLGILVSSGTVFKVEKNYFVIRLHNCYFRVKIYSIEVTDVEGGGSEKCVPCAAKGR